jgi:endonuclease/exonuclease/phosphatase family metal-dependent hydrolase
VDRDDVRMRVATYNLYLGADLSLVFGVRDRAALAEEAAVIRDQLTRTDFAARAAAVAAVLARERVDVVGVQELSRWSRIVGDGPPEVWSDFLPELLDALTRAGEPFDAHAVNTNFRGGGRVAEQESMEVVGANAVLVRRGGAVRVTGEETGDFTAMLRVPVGLDDLRVDIARSWGWVDAVADGQPFRFAVTHTEAYDAATRDAQRDELLARIGDPGVPVVLVGDFNSDPASVGVPAPYADAWVAAGNDAAGGLTCCQAADLSNPVGALAGRIDYVWVRDAAVTGCRVFGDGPSDRSATGLWPSDHAGVVADLSFLRE